MELLQYDFNIIVLILIGNNCVWSFSVEPKYTKFEYEEQRLEKVVRFEVYMENLNNAVQKFISDFSIIVNETKKFTEKEIRIGNDRMDLMKSEMDNFYQNVTSTMAQERQLAHDFQEQLNKTFVNKSEELTSLAVTPLIAFNAYGKTDGSFSSGAPVVFEEVLLNEGDCYDRTTGHFTASVDGIYQFNAQICFLKNFNLEYTIYVDSVSVIRGETRAASDSDDEKCDSFSVTTRVNKGQNVYVSAYGTKLDPNGDDWNSFSGSIIRQL